MGRELSPQRRTKYEKDSIEKGDAADWIVGLEDDMMYYDAESTTLWSGLYIKNLMKAIKGYEKDH